MTAVLTDILDDPKKALSLSERALVRWLDGGAAVKVKGGWFRDGTRHKDATLKPLVLQHLAEPTFRFGKHRLELNHNGRAVADALAGRNGTPPTEHSIRHRADLFD